MEKLEFLQSQKKITEAQIEALDRMNAAEMWGMKIMLKVGLEEIDRQIGEIEAGDIL